MATAFSTWTSEAPLRLAGCGIDAEQLDRFQKSAAGFCAAFCCKEALYKALSAPYTFTECELLAEWEDDAPRLHLSATLRAQYTIADTAVRLRWTPWRECVAEVHVFTGSANA